MFRLLILNLLLIPQLPNDEEFDSDTVEMSITVGNNPSYSRCNKLSGSNSYDCSSRNSQTQPTGDVEVRIDHKEEGRRK